MLVHVEMGRMHSSLGWNCKRLWETLLLKKPLTVPDLGIRDNHGQPLAFNSAKNQKCFNLHFKSYQAFYELMKQHEAALTRKVTSSEILAAPGTFATFPV